MNAENVKHEFENGKWQDEARQTMNNREKMDELKNKKSKFLNNPALSKIRDSLCLLWRYLEAVTSKRYTEYSVWALTKIVAVLIYVVNPFDLIPDVIFWAGWLDDILAVSYIISLTTDELDKFQKWEKRTTVA